MSDPGPLTDDQRDRFDALLEEALDELPDELKAMVETVPVIVLDEPTPELMREMGVTPDRYDEEKGLLCGLHSGRSNTEATVDASGEPPPDIHLFRVGIVNEAFAPDEAGIESDWDDEEADDRIYEQIWITLLHEIGHQFGLDEDDLERLGYG